MKILITGNLGYVGSELTRFILKKNKQIEIISSILIYIQMLMLKKLITR